MNRVKLGRLDRALATVDRRTAAEALSEWPVLVADGETNLGDVVVDSPASGSTRPTISPARPG